MTEDVRELAAEWLFDNEDGGPASRGYRWDEQSPAMQDYYRRKAEKLLAIAEPVIRRNVAETLRMISKGRASYLASYRSTDGWNETRMILDAEVESYATAAEIAEGSDEPLYSLLPSWMWTDGMNAKVDADDAAAAAIARSHAQHTETEK